jgi:hypothetical protein
VLEMSRTRRSLRGRRKRREREEGGKRTAG